jgi:hypothetical protein
MERKGRQAKTHHGKTQEADTRETVAGESPCGQHGPASIFPSPFNPAEAPSSSSPDPGLMPILNPAGCSLQGSTVFSFLTSNHSHRCKQWAAMSTHWVPPGCPNTGSCYN